ncbi:MAG: radical SAM protein [Candidatus Rokubacteria bacterium]|nr:radical SAM protein [Candidatus Rokubacteria bacterium]
MIPGALEGRDAQVLQPLLFEDIAALPPGARPLLAAQILPHIDGGLGDVAADRWVDAAFGVTHLLATRPWATQGEALDRTGLTPDELRRLNAAIRASDVLQALILDGGPGHKYWQTIMPLVRGGALQAAHAGTYRWPMRLGLYAGVSCMFFCTFCGRNYDAKYPAAALAPGNAAFTRLFEAAPRDGGATFSFSGGLEPLTNPRLGELVASATGHGIRVPLITNAYMLTAPLLRRQRGLWKLDSLRVSLYGVDEPTYYAVTRKKGAFAQVRANLEEFLRLRAAHNPRLRVGLNFIVLPGTVEQVLTLAHLIADIQDRAGAVPGFDFLTLREDFSVPAEKSLPERERERLIEVFAEFKSLMKRHAPAVAVDYGYALWALERGVLGPPLAMAGHRELRPAGYPQVSVAVDLLGDVYLYREAGFLERPGVERYCIGRMSAERSLEDVVRQHLAHGVPPVPTPDDPALLDAFDHVVTLMLNRLDADARIGFALADGPVRAA